MAIPELSKDPGSLDPQQLFADHGVLLVRQAISESTMDYLELLCSAVFSIFDIKVHEIARGEIRDDDPFVPYVRRYAALQFIGEDVVKSLLSQSYLCRSGFARVTDELQERLGSLFPGMPFGFVDGKSTVRRQGTRGRAQGSAFVPWHRDAHAVQTASLADCLNCWVPLGTVGIDRPSLQVVVGSNRVMRDRPVDYGAADNPADDEVLAAYGAESVCTPILHAGDILVFGHHTLHRTQPMGQDYSIRISGEFRFATSQPT